MQHEREHKSPEDTLRRVSLKQSEMDGSKSSAILSDPRHVRGLHEEHFQSGWRQVPSES